MTEIKKIGILTSGGDCAGLNAVISSVVSSAAKFGWEVYGIHNGTDGLTESPLSYEVLTESNFSDTPWPRLAGSYLGSLNKGVKMESQKAVSERFGRGVAELGLDAVVVVGGDGSMNIVSNYCHNAGVKMVGIPKTIDNDTPLTQYSVGFNSACKVCVEAIDALWKTARSHQRALILEVMGRDAGHLAMHSAVAGFADVCLVPEIPYTIDGIVNKLKSIKARGRNHAVIVVSEGVHTETGEMVSNTTNLIGEKINGGIGEYLSAALNAKYSSFQTRVTKLGHVQRAGDPTAFDRALACAFGARAVELLKEGHTDVMVALEGDQIKTYSLSDVVACGTTKLSADSVYVRAAVEMGMYVGEIRK